MQNFKSVSTRRINRVNRSPGRTVWQRNYYEHVIRSEKSLNAIRRYIEVNPTGWLRDPEYTSP
ncbi:MAG: transposase [Armatimonadetes bacterium]|nr:transposase [Armatimonadota bacterium]